MVHAQAPDDAGQGSHWVDRAWKPGFFCTNLPPPSAVWTFLTSGKNFATWCLEWKAPANAKISITRVGDVLDFTDQWGSGGRSIVTYLAKDKELRVAHEPHKGDYMCQAKLILEPTAKGTRVHFWEQYTDESKSEDMEATAKTVEAEMAKTLASLKQALEKK